MEGGEEAEEGWQGGMRTIPDILKKKNKRAKFSIGKNGEKGGLTRKPRFADW